MDAIVVRVSGIPTKALVEHSQLNRMLGILACFQRYMSTTSGWCRRLGDRSRQMQ